MRRCGDAAMALVGLPVVCVCVCVSVCFVCFGFGGGGGVGGGSTKIKKSEESTLPPPTRIFVCVSPTAESYGVESPKSALVERLGGFQKVLGRFGAVGDTTTGLLFFWDGRGYQKCKNNTPHARIAKPE